MPENAVYVGRPSRFGNPFTEGDNGCTCRTCVTLRYERLLGGDGIAEQFAELRGKDLACWCPLDGPCHADMLLIAANWSSQPEKTKAEFQSLKRIGEAIDALARE